MDPRFTEITAMLSNYFDGLYHSDAAKLARVFHPTALYACATDGTLLRLNMDEYFPIVARRPSPASRGESRHDRIISIEFAGPVTAMARVECAIAPKFFTDLLTLVYLDDRWQIISKIFHYELHPASVTDPQQSSRKENP